MRNLKKNLLQFAASCFNSRHMQKDLGKLFCLSSGEVLVYEYQGFKDDLLFDKEASEKN